MTDIEWATTSCSSWAMRRRSSASTLAALWRSASARSSASRTLASVAAFRLRNATPSAHTAENWVRTAKRADGVEIGGIAQCEHDDRGAHDHQPDDRPAKRAPRAHRVGEEQHGERERSFGPADEDVDEDPERRDHQGQQRGASPNGDRQARHEHRHDEPGLGLPEAVGDRTLVVADVLAERGDDADDREDDGEHAVDGKGVERPQPFELTLGPAHHSNVPKPPPSAHPSGERHAHQSRDVRPRVGRKPPASRRFPAPGADRWGVSFHVRTGDHNAMTTSTVHHPSINAGTDWPHPSAAFLHAARGRRARLRRRQGVRARRERGACARRRVRRVRERSLHGDHGPVRFGQVDADAQRRRARPPHLGHACSSVTPTSRSSTTAS